MGFFPDRDKRIEVNPWILARSKYELTHYLMEIFVYQRQVQNISFTFHITTYNWGSYLTSTDCSMTLVTEIGGMAQKGSKFKVLG